jgi:hypothetical protein
MTTYLHHHFAVTLMIGYVITITLTGVTWIFLVNRGARMLLREDVMGLIKVIDPGCRIQPKRNSSKHVCFFLTIGPPRIELYFDGGRNRLELFDPVARRSLDRKTVGNGIELTVPSIKTWIVTTLRENDLTKTTTRSS